MVTDAVHAEGGKIALQILHAGRYGYSPLSVAPSRAEVADHPRSRHRELSVRGIERQIRSFVRCAVLAREGGYDGVESWAPEATIIEFLTSYTNASHRRVGGSYENRMRLPVEIVRRVREAVGPDFIIIYRLSLIDLVPGGSV